MLFSVTVLTALAWATAAAGSPPRINHPPGHFKVDQVRNPSGRRIRSGPAEYARAHIKYGLPVPDALANAVSATSKVASSAAGGVGEVPAWAQEFDIEYLSPVFVGDPPQLVFLNFDTGSADTWMYSNETLEGHWAGQRKYTPGDSKSAQRVENSSWYISYGDGSYANGYAWKDTMALGDIHVPNMTVQTASSVSVMMMEDLNMSGLLGLCANHPSTVRPSQPTLLDLLEPILDDYVFTVDLRYHDTGRYTFGTVDSNDYEGNVTYVPTNKSSLYWEFNLNGMHISNSDKWYFYDWPMIADTGSTLMLLPTDLAELYWSQVPGVVYDDWWGSYLFPCNQTAILPDWEFDIGGFRGAVPGRYMNYQNVTETQCYGAIQPFPYDLGFGILGDVFLKAVFTVFDVRNKTLGFAKKGLWA